MSDSSFYELIKKQLEKEQGQLDAGGEVVKVVYPIIKDFERKEILNPIVLKISLKDMDEKYRDSVFGLFRIAVDGGPEGSYVVLDSGKVLYLIENVDTEDHHIDVPHDIDLDVLENVDFNSADIVSIIKALKGLTEEQKNMLIEMIVSKKKKKKGKTILGITSDIVHSIQSLLGAELSSLCHLVNSLIVEKVINTPRAEGGVVNKKQAEPLQKENTRSR
ncbi:MAG: hypothetical protein ACJAS6_000531 [Rickettsiales bacterium]|jgi:hypothetical protein